jgi:tRNA A-37 threonylcarbamoyl transferase component Bud32
MSEASTVPLERWSPVDALRIVISAVLLVVILLVDRLFGDALVSFISDVLAGFRTIDEDVVPAVAVVARIATLGVLGVGVVSATLRGHWRFLATVGVGAALGAGLVTLIDDLLDASAPAVVSADELLGFLGDTGFTAAGLAAITGVVAAGVPWFERRQRRIGWGLVLLLAFVRAFTEPVSLETAAALACGALGGALADAVLGTPSRRPTHAAVVEGLTRSGVDLADLHPASVDARGSTPYFGTTADGTLLFVKALGADERKADLLFRLVRTVMPRDLGDERPFSSLRRAVEHEALVALAAANEGVRTPPLAAFASAEPGGFVLAYEAIDGRSLDGAEPEEVTDEVLTGIWDQMAILRAHGIAHRDLRLANVFLAADGVVWMIDFGFSELAATDLLMATDLAELVLSLSLKVGAERAVAEAERGVGAGALQMSLSRFDPKYLSGATRTALKEHPELLADVRARIQAGSTS